MVVVVHNNMDGVFCCSSPQMRRHSTEATTPAPIPAPIPAPGQSSLATRSRHVTLPIDRLAIYSRTKFHIHGA